MDIDTPAPCSAPGLSTGTLLGTAACAGPKPGGAAAGSASAGAKASSSGPVSGTLTFAFWGGSDGETKGFTYVKDKFEAANPGREGPAQGRALRRVLRRDRPQPAGGQCPRRLPRRLHEHRQVLLQGRLST